MQKIRRFVSDTYKSDTWRQKVQKMGDAQVTAIYLSLKKRAKKGV